MQNWADNSPLHMQPIQELDVRWLLTDLSRSSRNLGPIPCLCVGASQHVSRSTSGHLSARMARPPFVPRFALVSGPMQPGWAACPALGQASSRPRVCGGGAPRKGKGGSDSDPKTTRLKKIVQVSRPNGFNISTQQAQAILATDKMGLKVDRLDGAALFTEVQKQA
eukprot:2748841-Amphidinium_carterae.1